MGLNELKIEITNKCLLKCVHCSTGAHSKLSSFISPQIFNDILSQATALGCKKIFLSGGEPLLHPNLDNFLELIKAKGLSSKAYSTGITHLSPPSAISKEGLKQLQKVGLSQLVFSMYSAKPNKHDSITKTPGSFSATLNAIQNALEVGLKAEIHFVATKLNINELPKLALLANKIGITKISVLRFVPQGRGKLSEQILTPTTNDYLKLKETVNSLKKKLPKIIFRLGSPFNFLMLGRPTPCTTGDDRMIIDVDGFAYPCDALKQVNLGKDSSSNVFNNSLRQVINEGSLFKLVRGDTTPIDCKNCVSLDICQSGCLAQRLLKGQNLSEIIDPGCMKTSSNIFLGVS